MNYDFLLKVGGSTNSVPNFDSAQVKTFWVNLKKKKLKNEESLNVFVLILFEK